MLLRFIKRKQLPQELILSREGEIDSVEPLEEPSSPEDLEYPLDWTEWYSQEVQRELPSEPKYLLNSSSPRSELPKSRVEFDELYRLGFIDMNDPPQPPDFCHFSNGYAAPRIDEQRRMRSLNSLHTFKGMHSRSPIPIYHFDHKKPQPPSPPLISAEILSQKPITNSPDCASLSFSPDSKFSDLSLSPPEFSSSSSSNGSPESIWSDGEGSPPMSWISDEKFSELENLAMEAKIYFHTADAKVGIMQENQHNFIVIAGDISRTHLDRGSTPCSHALLKASQELKAFSEVTPMVVLDISKDWRFNHIPDLRFYASSPILIPVEKLEKALSEPHQPLEVPIGLVCLIDDKPRGEFTSQDRIKLDDLAARASSEILRLEALKRKGHLTTLKSKRDRWRKETSKRKLKLESLGSIDEGSMVESDKWIEEGDQFDANEFDQVLENVPLPFINVACTSLSPITPKSKMNKSPKSKSKKISNTGIIVEAPKENLLIERDQNLLDMATRLISETMELEFVYVIKMEADESMKVVSAFNLPFPPPFFSKTAHSNFHQSDHSALLYTIEPTKLSEELFTTGLIVKIADGVTGGFLLGAFSDNDNRVISGDDLAWFRGFASDLRSRFFRYN